MSIEIEMRGVRWRSVGRPLSVETASDRRLQVARSCLPGGAVLRPVLPKRSDQPLPARSGIEAAGPGAANLRAGSPHGGRTPEAADLLEAKD